MKKINKEEDISSQEKKKKEVRGEDCNGGKPYFLSKAKSILPELETIQKFVLRFIVNCPPSCELKSVQGNIRFAVSVSMADSGEQTFDMIQHTGRPFSQHNRPSGSVKKITDICVQDIRLHETQLGLVFISNVQLLYFD